MKIRAFAIILLGCSISLSSCGKSGIIPGPKREVTSYHEKTFLVEKLDSLEIISDSSNIEVFSWDNDCIKFEITRKVRGIESEKILQKKLENFKIDITQNAGDIVFLSRYEGSSKNLADRSTDLKIFMPKRVGAINCKLDIGTIKFFDDIKCNFNGIIKTVNIDINRIEGKINLTGEMGNLRIQAGKIANCSMVNVNFGNIIINAAFQEGKSYSFETGAGNIELKLPPDAKASFECIGNLAENEFDNEICNTKIFLSSGMGKITIKKA